MSAQVRRDPDREVRRLFLRAVSLYVALVAANGLILGWLNYHEFDQRVIRERLIETVGQAQALADRIAETLGPGWADDPVRMEKSRASLSLMIGEHLEQTEVVGSVRVVNEQGHPIIHYQRGAQGAERVGPTSGSFSGVAPLMPDSPPSLATARDGRGAAPALDSRHVVEVPLAGSAGVLQLGVGQDAIGHEADKLRRRNLAILAASGVISLLLVVVAFLFVLRLLHRTQRLERDSQQAEKLAYIGTLASGLAHEIRNPLNAMNINMQMLEEEIVEGGRLGDDAVALLRSSRDEVQRLERLVRDFLAFARPRKAHRRELSPDDLVADVVRFIRPQFQDAEVQLTLRHEDGAPAVLVDASQIRQALFNMLQNALEVCDRGSHVEVIVGATEHGEARIEVHDEGPGVPPESRERIFEVFWSQKPAGTGLGLPIAQRAIESHGGRIELVSVEGKGSVFTIVLPSALLEANTEKGTELEATGEIT